MPGHAEYSGEHPAVRIRSKIGERRVYEARFLFRQFSEAIDAGERVTLGQELSQLLAEVDRLCHLARTAVAEGRRDEAVGLYREIERLAVDVPGVAEEQRALAGVEAIFSRIAVRKVVDNQPEQVVAAPPSAQEPKPDPEPEERAPLPTAGVEGADTAPGRAVAGRQYLQAWGQLGTKWLAARRFRLAFLWVATGCLGLALVLLLIRRDGTKEPPPASPPAPVPAQTILIKPLDGAPPTTAQPSPDQQPPVSFEQPAVKQPESAASPTETSERDEAASAPVPAPSSPALRLGVLQVEETGKR